MKFIISTLAAICGGLGLGGGTILMVYFMLTNTPQKEAQGINLLFIVPIALISTFISLKNGLISKKTITPLIISGIIGLALGTALLSFIDNTILKKIFSIFLIILGIRQLIYSCRSNY